jgi:integrase
VASNRKRGRVWYYTFIDHDDRKIESKGCTDKRETEDMATAAEVRSARIRNGEVSVRDADLPRQERRPIAEHVDAFEAMLQAKRSTPKHIHMNTLFIREIARLAAAETAAESTAESVTAASLALQAPRRAKDGEGEVSMSARTFNGYLRGVISLTRWLLNDKLVREDAVAGLSMLDQELDRSRIHRPLTPDEAAALIEAAESGSVVMGMSGSDRALLYAVVLVTGLRKSEAGSLSPKSFALESDPPSLTIEAS